ncbi:hypothetical protein H6501_02720 [Candidatus Woesearchaeota archaeon]|nr:hypothetical protein [Nanoarchaeota archaeon]MCB9370484.1 hypothetical protein [Candidatus Woesearchaeota archaeon]USN43562.1 MAG: hypothetical protein H6500_04165 [Candidatus Woesearchaeota archaeon]
MVSDERRDLLGKLLALCAEVKSLSDKNPNLSGTPQIRESIAVLQKSFEEELAGNFTVHEAQVQELNVKRLLSLDNAIVADYLTQQRNKKKQLERDKAEYLQTLNSLVTEYSNNLNSLSQLYGANAVQIQGFLQGLISERQRRIFAILTRVSTDFTEFSSGDVRNDALTEDVIKDLFYQFASFFVSENQRILSLDNPNRKKFVREISAYYERKKNEVDDFQYWKDIDKIKTLRAEMKNPQIKQDLEIVLTGFLSSSP